MNDKGFVIVMVSLFAMAAIGICAVTWGEVQTKRIEMTRRCPECGGMLFDAEVLLSVEQTSEKE